MVYSTNMQIFKIFITLNFILTFILGFVYKELTIAKVWINIHVNSIIGFQKVIENLQITQEYDLNIWYNIIVPLIDTSIFHSIIILILLILLILYQFISTFKAARNAS